MFIEVNDGNLEEGSFRCDANVSVHEAGQALGTRVELKNINSFRFVQKAIDHEIARQVALLEAGEAVRPETRGWDEASQTTYSLRSKEQAQDYRYFPEPDLQPLVLDDAFVDSVRAEMPELPRAKRARFVKDLALSSASAAVLTQHPRIAKLFEDTVALGTEPVRVANFIQSEVLRDFVVEGLSAETPVSAPQIAGLLALVGAGTISGKQAKEVYAKLRGSQRDARDVTGELGLAQVSDAALLEAIVRKLVLANPKQAAQLRAGKRGLMGYFVGLVMKETHGSANPKLTSELIDAVLEEPS
jgi:aspartyl-tRNA(Asn)/glutamyl-tRNA(Gln) amidotransferase subunit B